MNISKNQMTMCVIGGVALVATVALGYLAFSSYSAKSEAVEETEGAASSIQRLLRADVTPDKESELEYKKNTDALSGWCEAALAAASGGDRAIVSDVNEAAFKQRLVDEARTLSELDGGANGKIVKPDFTFGFPDYVTGDKLPEKEKLPLLQRQWGDIKTLVETLQSCGVEEVVAIGAAIPVAKPVQEEDAKKNRKKKRKGKVEEEKPTYTVEKYSVDFRAKPAALVKAVNALATSMRFIVVESMSFVREGDMIAAALVEEQKDAEAQKTTRRRGRRRQQEAQAEETGNSNDKSKKSGVVNDPATEAPFLVKMVVSTYDFGTASKTVEPEPAADEKAKEEEK